MTGWPVLTMVRGRTVMRDGELVGDKGHGTYLPRAKSLLARPQDTGRAAATP